MIVTVASGKGGTGKTMVAASLTAVWDSPTTAVDLDVEEPNLHLFLNPEIEGEKKGEMTVPVADRGRCDNCRDCVDLCQFKALLMLGKNLLVFPEMCHGCGGCFAICQRNVLQSGARELGDITWGHAGDTRFLMGRLRVGEAMSPPLMRQVKAKLSELLREKPSDVIVDAPPGTSCPAINAVKDSDLILLVTEPTPFGFHDLKLARQAFTALGSPMAVVINRAGLGDRAVYDYCAATGLPILAEIPFAREIAEAYSRGQLAIEVSAGYRALFQDLARNIRVLVQNPREALCG